MKTNPNAIRILCFGDSNTWGYIPNSGHVRYNANIRWPGVLQTLLGNKYEVIEEGLNSRGILLGDSREGKEGRSAKDYIIPCLDTHDPLDFIIVFLGTNELKAEFDLSANMIGDNLRELIYIISNRPSQFKAEKPKVVLVVPPVLNEATEYASKNNKYLGANTKSKLLGDVYRSIANETNSVVVDIQDSLETGEDGVHLTVNGHLALAETLSVLLIS